MAKKNKKEQVENLPEVESCEAVKAEEPKAPAKSIVVA